MSQPFLALITPLASGGVPSHPISLPGDPGFGQIPGFTPGTPPPRPHPQPPLGIWGGPWLPPYPDQGLPGPQPRPEHPIYIPVVPPTTGEGGEHPEHPIYIPVYPAHPIYYPPYPAHPIVIPPEITSPGEIYQQIKAKLEFIFGNLPENPNPTPEPV